MMLTTDAFSGGGGEMERLRTAGSSVPANGEKAGKNAKTVENGDSFPGMLESIQNAMDKAGEASPEGKAVLVGIAEEDDGALSGAVLEKDSLPGKSLKRAAREEKLKAEGTELDGAPELRFSPLALSLPQKAEIAANYALVEAEPAEAAAENASGIEESLFRKTADFLAVAPAQDAAQDAQLLLRREALADEDAHLFADAGAEKSKDPAALERKASSFAAAQASGSKPAEGAEEKPRFSVMDLRADELPAEKLRSVQSDFRGASAADSRAALAENVMQASSDADIEMHLYFNSDSALESSSGFAKEGFSAAAEGSFFSQGSRASGEGALGASQGSGAYGSFAERLGSELRSSAADIVRAGQLVLRNGGEGTIRLALHPETLGDVRIHLEMSGDKKIAGKITVSSREAWDAFSESMDSLALAFSDEGFDTLGFDLSWAGREGAGIPGGAASSPFYASSIPNVMAEGDLSDDYSIAVAARRHGSPYTVDIFA